jgi:DNA-directed RNA polymerase specialized sigma24 family protein
LPSQGRDDAVEASDQIFIDLVDGELRPAYRLASFLLGDVVEAEDATQDAILQAWRGWPQLRESASFPGWFERILRRSAPLKPFGPAIPARARRREVNPGSR